MQNEPGSILVVDASPFGRGLMMLPAARTLRQALPNTYITVAAARGVCELVATAGLADETIDLGGIQISQQNLGGAVKRLFQLTKRGRRSGYDWVLDFSPRLETQFASFLSWRARHVTPSKVSQLLDLFLKGNGSFAGDHLGECASVLKQVGLKKIDSRFVIPVSNAESLRFEGRLTSNRSREAKPREASLVVVLYSSMVGEAGEWSAEKYADIAWRLTNNFDARVVVIDEPAENRFTTVVKPLLPAQAICLTAPRVIELVAAIERASLVITDERGIAKVALDADAPVIEIGDSPSPFSESTSYRLLRSSSRARVETDAVFETACELIQSSRTSSIIGR